MNRWRSLFAITGLVLLVVGVAVVWAQSRRSIAVKTFTPTVVPGGSLVVVVSPNNRDVWAYSKFTGQWYLQSLAAAARQPIQPFTGDIVALFQANRRIYAFSAPRGTWDVLDLPEGVQARPEVMEDWCYVTAGTDVYGFMRTDRQVGDAVACLAMSHYFVCLLRRRLPA